MIWKLLCWLGFHDPEFKVHRINPSSPGYSTTLVCRNCGCTVVPR